MNTPSEIPGILLPSGLMEAAAEAARRLVKERAQEKNLALKTISERIGRSHSYIQQYVSRGSPLYLPERERQAVARMLDIPLAALTPPPLSPEIQPDAQFPYDPVMLRKLIVRGFIAGADQDGAETFAERVVEAYERIQRAKIEAGQADDPLIAMALFKKEN